MIEDDQHLDDDYNFYYYLLNINTRIVDGSANTVAAAADKSQTYIPLAGCVNCGGSKKMNRFLWRCATGIIFSNLLDYPL